MSIKFLALLCLVSLCGTASAQVAVRGDRVYTMSGPPIVDGIVIIERGKIRAVGRSADITVPDGMEIRSAAVVTPGLIDGHSVVGLAGQYNSDEDQDQLERSTPVQPQLRAMDAYNPNERLVEWIRGFGVTTLHTGHAPGELVSGQTFVVKTTGATVAEALLQSRTAIAVTLGEAALKKKDKSPGTRSKMMALLREKLVAAKAYRSDRKRRKGEKRPAQSLELDALSDVLKGDVPLLITAHRAHDIANALRLAHEFSIPIVLDGAAEAYLLIDEIKAAKVPVIIHPTMARAHKETENLSMTTAARLIHAGVPVALQSGFESYVPKTRVVLFEAAVAAANGLTFEEALATVTTSPAQILGLDDRVGSIEVGKDGDLALYDGDPFEYTTHCLATIIEGTVVHDEPR